MTLRFVERFLRLQDLIEKRAPTLFLGCAAIVALVTSWGL